MRRGEGLLMAKAGEEGGGGLCELILHFYINCVGYRKGDGERILV
jgi:hypothetical protein